MSRKRSSSSSRWLQEHFSDKYVQQTHKKKLYSRAWFKLHEIDHNYALFRPGITVIDLGAAHGGWSQYVTTQIGNRGRVIACDILPMHSIVGVDFIKGDVREPRILQALLELIGKNKVQVVLSDMMPNMSGISIIDVAQSISLAKLALGICQSVLELGGNFLVKVLYGEGFNEFLSEIRPLFMKVQVCKPDASRNRSREVYILAIKRI